MVLDTRAAAALAVRTTVPAPTATTAGHQEDTDPEASAVPVDQEDLADTVPRVAAPVGMVHPVGLEAAEVVGSEESSSAKARVGLTTATASVRASRSSFSSLSLFLSLLAPAAPGRPRSRVWPGQWFVQVSTPTVFLMCLLAPLA